jgi:hypothetical protein
LLPDPVGGLALSISRASLKQGADMDYYSDAEFYAAQTGDYDYADTVAFEPDVYLDFHNHYAASRKLIVEYSNPAMHSRRMPAIDSPLAPYVERATGVVWQQTVYPF